MTFGVVRVIIIKMIVIPNNSVANQNAVELLLWNAVFPLDVDCCGACVVNGDNCRTNSGHCAINKTKIIVSDFVGVNIFPTNLIYPFFNHSTETQVLSMNCDHQTLNMVSDQCKLKVRALCGNHSIKVRPFYI